MSGYGNCKAGDVECICKNQEAQSTIGTCLQEKCSASDQKSTFYAFILHSNLWKLIVLAAIQFADSLCQSAGVTIPTTIAPQTTGATTTHATGTGTITSAPTTATTTTAHSNTTANHTTTTTHSTATGAAATGYVANGLGVAGAAVAAFFFL